MDCEACYHPLTEGDHTACTDWLMESAEAEIRAEFAMSWVCGGGHPDDTSAAFSAYRP